MQNNAQPQTNVKSAVKVVQALCLGLAVLFSGTLLAVAYDVIHPQAIQAAMLVIGSLVGLLAVLSTLFIRVLQARRRRTE